MRVGLLVVLLGVGGCAAADLPPAVRAELPAAATVVAGSYRQVRQWEAELPQNHLTGRRVDDATASGGAAWEALVGRDASDKALLYGPYVELPAGRYLALFRAKATEAAEDDEVARLDAVVQFGSRPLARRGLLSGDLRTDGWVQVPLLFDYPGGKLECRLFWNGYAGLRLDCVTLYAVEAPLTGVATPRAPHPAPSGRPSGLTAPDELRPYPDIFPRSSAPARRLVVADLRQAAPDERLLLLSLQGLVNRERPRLYLVFGDAEARWLDWLQTLGWADAPERVAEPWTLVKRFADRYRGLVVVDPRLPATRNVATMVAGVRDLLIASPRLAKRLGLPVVEDLRGRFRTNVAAYRWSFEQLWPQLDHHVVAVLWPDEASGLRDYLVQHRVFTFWVSGPLDGVAPGGDPTAELHLMEELLAKMPPNTPAMGFPWAGEDVGIGEGGGVSLLAWYGKFLVGSVGCSNLTVHSGYPVPEVQQRRQPAPPLDARKVYVTWLMSDGDNLPVLSHGNFPQLWASPQRGQVPIAWTMSPCAPVLMPAVVNWYLQHATPNDVFVSAVSGIGYTYPDQYAERYEPVTRQRLFDGFLDLTAAHAPRADLRSAWVMGVQQPELIRRYAERLPYLEALFPDYGQTVRSYDAAFYGSARGVPVFHAATGWDEQATREQRIQRFVTDIRRLTPTERPAFLHVFIWNWGADLSILAEVHQRLGADYQAVLPEQLAGLARQHLASSQVLLRSPRSAVALAGRRLQFEAEARNSTAQALSAKATVEGLKGGTVSPAEGVVPAYGALSLAVTGEPTGRVCRVTVSGPYGQRTADVSLQLLPVAEVGGQLPDRPLSFVERFAASGLAHRAGQAAPDQGALAGDTWTATAGQTATGHIVFGPYRPTPAGRYLVIFRLKRTGPGDGLLLKLDTAVGGGGVPSSSQRDVRAGELPPGEWRCLPLLCEHPGGALETRVFWTGAASVAIDSVVLWRVR